MPDTKVFRTRFRSHRRPGVFGSSQGHGLPGNSYKLDAVGFDAVVTTSEACQRTRSS
jgi:hypothetical protein